MKLALATEIAEQVIEALDPPCTCHCITAAGSVRSAERLRAWLEETQ